LLNAVVEGRREDLHRRHRQRHDAPHAPARAGQDLIEAPTAGKSATCKSCAHCPWMAMNALQGVVACLENGQRRDPRAEPVRAQALGCIERMLDFVKAHPAAIQKPGFARTSARRTHRHVRASTKTLEAARARNIRDALPRTSASGDWTACWCPPAARARPGARARRRCCAAATGSTACVRGARRARPGSTGTWPKAHGWRPTTRWCDIEADARALLAAERPALNFLQLLSGTAT
jgi:hypothetical protein